MKKRVLVTGGAGFIGSNLICDLLNSGQYSVICIDCFDPFYSVNIKRNNIEPFLSSGDFRLIEGTITSPESIQQVGEIDIIVHLAAKPGVRPSVLNPNEYFDVNVLGTINLLEFARARKIKQFVFASSSSVYGINNAMPWAEDSIIQPISPYAASKHSAEMIGQVYSHLHGLRFISLRFFSVYGPGQRPDLAVHKFFDAIMRMQAITMFGDGSSSRDYTFVGDICTGIKKAMEYDNSMFEVINIGNTSVYSLADLIGQIEAICGKTAIIHRVAEQAGDVKHTYADIDKAKRLLNYQPSVTLAEGLALFYQWYLNAYFYNAEIAVR